MSDQTFQELVSRKVDDAKWPPPLPAGSYYGVVKAFKFDYLPFKDQNNNPIPGCIMTFGVTGPAEASLEEETSDVNWAAKSITNNYRLGAGEDAPLGDLVRSLLGADASGRSFGETIPACVGKAVLMDITKDINKKNPESPPRNNVRRVVARPES